MQERLRLKSKHEGGLRAQGIWKTSLPGKPLISVITVVLNGADTLGRAIQSVLDQSYNNIEYIIVDGDSTDGTLDVVQSYEHSVDYWVSEPDCGIYDAFNKAIRLAHGDYYVVLGCDDELFQGGVKQVVDTLLIDNNVDFVVASMLLGGRLRTGMRPGLGWLGAHAMVNGHSVGMLIRTKVHEQVGYYSTAFRLAADALFIKKLFLSGLRGVASDAVMGRFAVGGASNKNLARGLCEEFIVQLETERFKGLQVIIFIARLIKNIRRLGC